MTAHAKRSGRDWSEADLKRMRAYAAARVSARVAAEKLGRSPGALRFKAMNEGISFRSINRKTRRRTRRAA